VANVAIFLGYAISVGMRANGQCAKSAFNDSALIDSVDGLLTHRRAWAILLRMAKRKQPVAVVLGRRRAATAAPGEMSEIGKIGAPLGGVARATKLTRSPRQDIARKASAAGGLRRKGLDRGEK
jgi:hypothetical protein